MKSLTLLLALTLSACSGTAPLAGVSSGGSVPLPQPSQTIAIHRSATAQLLAPPPLPVAWLDWTAPVDADGLIGYNLYLGVLPATYLGHIELGDQTSIAVHNNHPDTYVAVSARYPEWESSLSNEVHFTAP